MTGVYERALGEAADDLHPKVRDRYSLGPEDGVTVGRGRMDISRGIHTLPALYAMTSRDMLFPEAGNDVRFAVTTVGYELDGHGLVVVVGGGAKHVLEEMQQPVAVGLDGDGVGDGDVDSAVGCLCMPPPLAGTLCKVDRLGLGDGLAGLGYSAEVVYHRHHPLYRVLDGVDVVLAWVVPQEFEVAAGDRQGVTEVVGDDAGELV